MLSQEKPFNFLSTWSNYWGNLFTVGSNYFWWNMNVRIQSHYIEVAQGTIFMEQNMRCGQIWVDHWTKNDYWHLVFSVWFLVIQWKDHMYMTVYRNSILLHWRNLSIFVYLAMPVQLVNLIQFLKQSFHNGVKQFLK